MRDRHVDLVRLAHAPTESRVDVNGRHLDPLPKAVSRDGGAEHLCIGVRNRGRSHMHLRVCRRAHRIVYGDRVAVDLAWYGTVDVAEAVRGGEHVFGRDERPSTEGFEGRVRIHPRDSEREPLAYTACPELKHDAASTRSL